MTKKLIFWGSVLCTCLVTILAYSEAKEQTPQPAPPARKIPGIVSKDPYPRACVDCHINYVEMNLDTRFSTQMNQWSEKVQPKLLAKAQASAPRGMILQGKHPKVTGAFRDIPGECLRCHNKGSQTSPPFGDLMHNIHLTGGEENHFLTLFQGECTYCHKLDLSTGHWTIPTAAER